MARYLVSAIRSVVVAAAALLLVSAAHGQVIGLQPTPIGMYTWNSSTQQWVQVTGTQTSNPLPSTPQAFGFYVYNTTLGQWVPCATLASCFGGNAGTVTSFSAPSASWPSWLVPTVTNPTTTPTLTVAASPIPLTALASISANTVLGATTSASPGALAVPSCSGTNQALTWTSGTGFGCATVGGSGVGAGVVPELPWYSTTSGIQGDPNLFDFGQSPVSMSSSYSFTGNIAEDAYSNVTFQLAPAPTLPANATGIYITPNVGTMPATFRYLENVTLYYTSQSGGVWTAFDPTLHGTQASVSASGATAVLRGTLGTLSSYALAYLNYTGGLNIANGLGYDYNFATTAPAGGGANGSANFNFFAAQGDDSIDYGADFTATLVAGGNGSGSGGGENFLFQATSPWKNSANFKVLLNGGRQGNTGSFIVMNPTAWGLYGPMANFYFIGGQSTLPPNENGCITCFETYLNSGGSSTGNFLLTSINQSANATGANDYTISLGNTQPTDQPLAHVAEFSVNVAGVASQFVANNGDYIGNINLSTSVTSSGSTSMANSGNLIISLSNTGASAGGRFQLTATGPMEWTALNSSLDSSGNLKLGSLSAGAGNCVNIGSGGLLQSSGAVCGSGTVTSVGLALPASAFAVSGSPVTSTGTLTAAWAANPGVNATGGSVTLPSTTSWYSAVSGGNNRIASISYGGIPYFSTVIFGGTVSSPSAVTSGQQLGGINMWGAIDTGGVPQGPSGTFRCYAAENWSSGHQGTNCRIGTTPVGSSTEADVMIWGADSGIYTPSATGGDEGAGSINAQALLVNGVNVSTTSTTSTPGWLMNLGVGQDGSNTTASGAMAGQFFYTNFTVPLGNTVTVNTSNGLVIHATGTCTINGTITAIGIGNGGAWGAGGGGSGGGTAAGTSGQGTTVPGGTSTITAGGSAGGSSGGNGGAGVSPNTAAQRTAWTGASSSGGSYVSGGKGSAGGSSGGGQGLGGGGVVLICGQIAGSGTIDVSGAYGSPAAANSTGGGSGGGGGVVILSSQQAATWTGTIYHAPGAGSLATVPEAVGESGSCTTTPQLTLGVSGGALNSCTVTVAGAGCGSGTGVNWFILGGGGTGGTVTPTWSGGAVASCTASGGSGYTAATYTNSGTGGPGGNGWGVLMSGWGTASPSITTY